jgi:hypothetical protein
MTVDRFQWCIVAFWWLVILGACGMALGSK